MIETNKTKDSQSSILCPTQLVFPNGESYVLSSVINQMGEASDPGHYNIVIFDESRSKFILVDTTEINDDVKLKDMAEISYVDAYKNIINNSLGDRIFKQTQQNFDTKLYFRKSW